MNPPAFPDWNVAADALHAAFPVARWPERVRTWLATEAGGDEPWCVALSGGADSVAVLLTLVACRDELRRNAEWRMQNGECGLRNDRGAVLQPAPADSAEAQLRGLKHRATAESVRASEIRNPQSAIRNRVAPFVALHFNHRLRGAAAEGDEQFCRELCAALGVELRVGAADWPAGTAVSEAQAREARFTFFDRTMREVGARALWLGHQRDDVVETMLLRLSRGSGTRGLAAPRPVQRLADGTVRLRPLLDVPKAAIVAVLRAAGVPWREDESNRGDGYFRNRLRNRVVPAWREAAPVDLAAAVARSRALLEEDDDALEAWVDRILPAELSETLPLADLRAVPVAVTRRALHRWLGARELGEALASAAFEELLAAVRAGRPAKLSAGEHGFLETDGGVLRLGEPEVPAPEWGGVALAVPGEVGLPDGARVQAVQVALDAELYGRICAGEFDDGRTAFVALMDTEGGFSIRSWRAGDRYRPLGAAGAQKLQDQFVNRRVPRGLRGRLPVVCALSGGIIWVPGLPPADEAKLLDGTRVAVQLTYLPAVSLSASSGHV